MKNDNEGAAIHEAVDTAVEMRRGLNGVERLYWRLVGALMKIKMARASRVILSNREDKGDGEG